jgi:hypothetical protein
LVIKYDSRHFSVFDLATMNRLTDYVFSDPVSVLTLSRNGDRLFALTNNQTVYQLSVASEPMQKAAASAKNN